MCSLFVDVYIGLVDTGARREDRDYVSCEGMYKFKIHS